MRRTCISRTRLLNLIIFVTLFALLFQGIRAYFDRPMVEVSVVTGKCLRAYGPKGPMSCDVAMKSSYEKVIVDF